MNKFTSIIHGKGWTVKDAIEFWDIDYSTYNRRCNNPKMFNQLESMCLGLNPNSDMEGFFDEVFKRQVTNEKTP